MPGKKRGVGSVAVQNAAKTLAANIRFASVDNPVSSIVVTSSIPGEGKTFVSIELAKALAASGKRVLIMECDMRKRSLAARLGRHGLHGIYDVLSGEADITEAVTPTGTENLWFLDAEPNIPNPTDIVSSKRFRGLLQGLRREFGYVVMDTPPLGAFVDAAVLGSVADATVLVVRQNFVRRDDMVASFTQLKQADANVIGTVLNYCEDDGLGHYGYYGSYAEEPAKASAARPARAEKDMPVVQAAPAAQRPVSQVPSPVQMPARAQAPAQARTQAQAPAQTHAHAHAHAHAQPSDQEVSVPGIRPVPTRERGHIPPDSTAQLIAGYTPREYTDD